MNLFQMPTDDGDRGLDGEQWIFEGVAGGKYHVIQRFCASYDPKKRGLEPFLALCKFLIDKSTLSERPKNGRHELIPKDSDQLWAEALWQSIPSNDTPSDKVEALLVAALVQAKHRAPIHGFLAQCGPNRMRHIFRGILRIVDEEAKFAADDLKLLPGLDLQDARNSAFAIQTILENSYRKAVDKKSVWSRIDE